MGCHVVVVAEGVSSLVAVVAAVEVAVVVAVAVAAAAGGGGCGTKPTTSSATVISYVM